MADTIAFGMLAVVLLIAAVADARTQHIHKAVTYGGLLAGLVYWTIVGLIEAGLVGAGNRVATSLLACAAGYVPFAIIFAAGGLGGGDVKLMAAIGALSASWKLVLATAAYGFVVMFVMAVVVMVRHRIVGRTLKRIAGAALVAMARVKPDLPTDSPRIPFAVAACIGGLVAGIEFLLHVRLPWTDLGP